MAAPIVFFDIASPDADGLRAFYADVFGWGDPAEEQFEVPVVAPLSGHIREDPPESRLYLGVPDITATLKEIEAHGGSIDVPRFEVPGRVVIALFRDPAGNPMGLVEMEGDSHKVP